MNHRKRYAFWSDESYVERQPDGKVVYSVIVAQEGEPGYHVWSRGWADLDAARAYADAENDRIGVSHPEALDILVASMVAQHA